MARDFTIQAAKIHDSKEIHFDVDGEIIVWTEDGAVLSTYPSVAQLREIKAWASELLHETD